MQFGCINHPILLITLLITKSILYSTDSKNEINTNFHRNYFNICISEMSNYFFTNPYLPILYICVVQDNTHFTYSLKLNISTLSSSTEIPYVLNVTKCIIWCIMLSDILFPVVNFILVCRLSHYVMFDILLDTLRTLMAILISVEVSVLDVYFIVGCEVLVVNMYILY